MKVIVAGSRSIKQESIVACAIRQSGFAMSELVSGTAQGVDRLAETLCKHLPTTRFPADWSQGRQAGILRNREMATYADALIAVWDGQSAGTRHMIETMRALGKPVYVHISLGKETTMKRPYEPFVLRRALAGMTARFSTGGEALDGWYLRAGAEHAPAVIRKRLWMVSGAMKEALGGEEDYREVLNWLTGHDTVSDCTVAQVAALQEWLFTEQGQRSANVTHTAKAEARAIFRQAVADKTVRKEYEWWRTGETALNRLLADCMETQNDLYFAYREWKGRIGKVTAQHIRDYCEVSFGDPDSHETAWTLAGFEQMEESTLIWRGDLAYGTWMGVLHVALASRKRLCHVIAYLWQDGRGEVDHE